MSFDIIDQARKFICVLGGVVLWESLCVLGVNCANFPNLLETAIPNVLAEQEAILSKMPNMSMGPQEIHVEKNRQKALDLLNEAINKIVDSDYFRAERILENLLMQFNYFADIEEIVLVLIHFVNLMLGRSFESTENIEIIFMNKFSQSQYLPYMMYIYIIQISQKISASLAPILQTDLDNIAKVIKKLSICDHRQHYYLQACRYQKKVMKQKLWYGYKMAKFYCHAKEPIATMMTCSEYWSGRRGILFDKYDENMKTFMRKASKKILLREGLGNSCLVYEEDDLAMTIAEVIPKMASGLGHDVHVMHDQMKQISSQMKQLLLFWSHNQKIWQYHLAAREQLILELRKVGDDIATATTKTAKVVEEINSPMSLEQTMSVLKSEMMKWGKRNAVPVIKYAMTHKLPMRQTNVFELRKNLPYQNKQVFEMREKPLQSWYSFGN